MDDAPKLDHDWFERAEMRRGDKVIRVRKSASMDLAAILDAANRWLDQQPAPDRGSGEWYALGNFRKFLASISENAAPPALEQACFVIRRFIVDQFDWEAAYSKAISGYVEQVGQFAKDEAWRRRSSEGR